MEELLTNENLPFILTMIGLGIILYVRLFIISKPKK